MPDLIIPIISIFVVTIVLIILISERDDLIAGKHILYLLYIVEFGSILSFGEALSNLPALQQAVKYFQMFAPLVALPLLIHYLYLRAIGKKEQNRLYSILIFIIPLFIFIFDSFLIRFGIEHITILTFLTRVIYLLAAILFIKLIIKKENNKFPKSAFIITTIPIFITNLVLIITNANFSIGNEIIISIASTTIALGTLIGLSTGNVLLPYSLFLGKIKTQLFSILLFLSSLIVIIATGIAYAITTDISNSKVSQEFNTAINAHSSALNAYVDSIDRHISGLLERNLLNNYIETPSNQNANELILYAKEIVNRNPKISGMSFIFPENDNVNSVYYPIDLRIREAQYTLKDNYFFVIRDANEEQINILTKKIEINDTPIYVVTEYSYDTLIAAVADNYTEYNSFVAFIINEKGELITPTKNFENIEIDLLSENLTCQISEEPKIIEEESLSSKSDYIRYSTNIAPYNICIVAQADKTEITEPIKSAIGLVVLSGLFSLMFVTIVSDLIGALLSTPLIEIIKDLNIIRQGDLNHKSKIRFNNELGQLSHSVNDLTARLKDIYENFDNKVNQQTKDLKERESELIKQQKQMIKILEDIELEKNNSEILASQLKKFELAIQNTSEHIVITDETGTIIFANTAVEKISGYKVEEVLGQKAGSTENWGGLMPKSVYEKFWKTISVDKKTYNGEFRNRRKDGSEYQVQASVSPILDNKGNVQFYVGIERDITQEKNIDKVKTEFVSLASHQLRTPLSAISWYTEMLLDEDAGPITIGQKEYLSEIYEGNKRMIDLVSALLNVSRLELGTFSIEPEKKDLIELIKNVIKDFEPLRKEKKVNINTSFAKDKLEMNIDNKLLYIVFQNIISNAIKYNKKGGDVNIDLKVGRKYIKIDISDTGIGIPKEEQKDLFGKLFRASNARDQVIEGTGLGLYIVKSILENTGGSISFKSEVDKGTTFTISILKKGMIQRKGKKRLE